MSDDFNFGLVTIVIPMIVIYIWSIINERGGK